MRCGIITYPAKPAEEMKQLIKDVESVLIYEMRNELRKNKKGLNRYVPKHLYVITNTCYRGMLSAEISMESHITSD